MKLRILLVDDDTQLVKEIVTQLGSTHDLHAESDFAKSLDQVEVLRPNLVLLDYRLEKEDGIRWLDSLRARGHRTPVVIMSGYPDQQMAIDFMKRSVFGFVEKPFLMDELIKTINAVMNLTPARGFELNRGARCVLDEGRRIDLTPTEFKILELLVDNAGSTVERQTLIKKAMGRESVSRNALDTHIFNLKRKIPALNEKVRVVYGHGFIYDA